MATKKKKLELTERPKCAVDKCCLKIIEALKPTDMRSIDKHSYNNAIGEIMTRTLSPWDPDHGKRNSGVSTFLDLMEDFYQSIDVLQNDGRPELGCQ